MTTPNTEISSLSLGNINEELNFATSTARSFNDGIFRNLTGQQARTISNTVINLSDLSGKTAFGGIISANSSNVTSYGVINRTINLLANTDMYSPSVVWEAELISGVAGTLTTNGKQASYTITGVQESNVSANVLITATLSYGSHEIGVASKYISFEINSLPPLLFVNGNTEANSITFEPTTASTSLIATANAPGSTIVFSVSPNDAGVFISGNTVVLSSSAPLVGQDNNRTYSVYTKLLFDGQIIGEDLKNVTVRAFYQTPDFIYDVPATTNNHFANTGTIHSSLLGSVTHSIPGANVEWAATKVSGETATLTIASDLGSANLHINVASGSFETKKSIYDLVATLKYANGQFITSKTKRLTLRTGAYGLNFNPAANVVASGYSSQTAIAVSSASYQAGILSWNIARVSGNTATVANTVTTTSGTVQLSLSTSNVETSIAVYRVNPVLTYDGIVMANVTSQTQITAQQNAYSFSLSGPTSNTQLGSAPVVSTIVTTAAHDVSGGDVSWSKSTSASVLNVNLLQATTTYTNNTIGSDTFTLSATLLDDQGRVIKTINRSLVQRSYYPDIKWIGSNNVTSIGYVNQNAVASVNTSVRAGATSFNVSADKLTGGTLDFTVVSGNTSIKVTNLVASQNTVGTEEGLYRLTATVEWFGVSNSSTYDVSVSATREDAEFTLNGSGESKNSYNFPVVANGEFVASHSVPQGSITWSRTINSGSVTDTPVSNATNYVFRVSRSTVGTSTANVTVTATLRDANGGLIESKSEVETAASTVNNPVLELSGPSSNTVSNTFHAAASITLTPSVAAGLTGHTYVFSTVAVSGSATITSNSSAIVLTNTFDGAGTVSGTYDVTCKARLNGQDIASVTRRVSVTATCPAPTYNFTSNNDSVGSFNFPVNSYAQAEASSSPAGAVISWSWSKVSGATANLYTEASNSRFVVNCQQSSIGSISSVYDLTATYRTPNGTLLTTKTARVTATSNRYNPALVWNYVGSTTGSNTVSGFDENLSSSISLKGSANASLTGETYRITSTKVGGNKTSTVTTANSTASATVTLTNNRTTNGTGEKTSVYDVFVDIVLNSQVIAGVASRRVNLEIDPNVIATPDLDGFNQTSGEFSQSFIMVGADGRTSVSNNTSTVYNNWMSPVDLSEVSNYQVYFTGTNTGGTLLATTLNTWLDIVDNPFVKLNVRTPVKYPDNPASAGASGTYAIRNKTTGVVQSTGNWTLEAHAGFV